MSPDGPSIYDMVFDAVKNSGKELVIDQDGDDKIGIGEKQIIKLRLVVRKAGNKGSIISERVRHPEHINTAASRLRDRLLERKLIGK